ncbi:MULTISPECIES: formyltetrahydrofolate deformylase [unclassified Neptuniibacter]|jgi:formyltetrahydrofolate deformylase|uniref:formyltetrahydrofolate deformylase n=1 Tax=unclassified Neptuniibacter TaxID=2630693 RepID=UPI0026E2999A|nr:MULTISPECIES: formyltetrahydrofolate deformylase [unclassified Neptuniibacter]MDO6513550.1 formyltetrahydrofolate deformylase [Neptuniibacter sp. 2_MG-2023]MDO6593696.1 formyltetrahydrofolate deformylase [Neptuniibacter sp. 1_MG-2023]
MKSTDTKEFILKTNCVAGSGIVAAVSSFLSERGCYISEMNQFDDPESGQFFMRMRFHVESGEYELDQLSAEFVAISEKFKMDWRMVAANAPTKTLIMVSKFDHCLDDLMYRLHKGEINMEITAIVSNHKDLRPMAEREGIRFIHLPVTKDNKPEQEQALLDVVEETGTELVVLARYMQILSDNLCKELSGRAINIHHSFLPGFKGAKPYHQAHTRGVKLIGATAHYVTSDLDEGPIIEQSVQPVDHTYSPEALVAVGRDTETVALARAVKLHVDHRVFLDGNKTVVFK